MVNRNLKLFKRYCRMLNIGVSKTISNEYDIFVLFNNLGIKVEYGDIKVDYRYIIIDVKEIEYKIKNKSNVKEKLYKVLNLINPKIDENIFKANLNEAIEYSIKGYALKNKSIMLPVDTESEQYNYIKDVMLSNDRGKILEIAIELMKKEYRSRIDCITIYTIGRANDKRSVYKIENLKTYTIINIIEEKGNLTNKLIKYENGMFSKIDNDKEVEYLLSI